MFLSGEDFKKSMQILPEEAKFATDLNFFKKKTRSIFITMNEELSSNNTKKELSGNLNGSQEEQYESIDERKKLLYDKHAINRQKAAVNICKMIVDEVKQKYGYFEQPEDSEKSRSDSSNTSEIKLPLDVTKLVKKTENCENLKEKLEKISEISDKLFQKTANANQAKKKLNFKNELLVGEFEETISHDSNIHRISKSKDKMLKEDLLQHPGDFSELLPEVPYFYISHKIAYTQILSQLPLLPISPNPQACGSLLLQRLEITSPTLSRLNKLKRSFTSFNRNCISLPELRLDASLGQYIAYHFTGYRSLLRVDLSGNPLGDKTSALLIYCLNNFSEGLEYLDMSSTNLSKHSARALQYMLKSSSLRLQYLKIENNFLKDEGFCCLAIGLLNNTSLVYLNIAENGIETAGGFAIGKVMRINRSLKGLNLSKSLIRGNALREICRALIVNAEVNSLVLTACKLDDEDMKEIGHLLNANNKLQQLGLAQNRITQRGLEHLKYGLPRNKYLIHLALSGNKDIRLAVLEKLKDSMSKFFDIDIGKEADFFKTPEAKKFKLIDYIGYIRCF